MYYGLAVDIGTTNIEIALCNREGSQVFGSKKEKTLGGRYGLDILSVLLKGKKGLGREISESLAGQIKSMGTYLVEKQGGLETDIKSVSVAANTVMELFAAGMDPSSIAVPPFTPVSTLGCKLTDANSPLLAAFPGAEIYLAPCIAGYIGGDITSGLAYVFSVSQCKNINPEDLTLYIDIGTNGEMALGSQTSGFTCCAVAAGPAFSSGGLYGSELINATADLRRAGSIGRSGRIHIPEGFSNLPKLSAETVHNLQLAKGALRAGIECLLASSNVSLENVKHFIVAGDFGERINIENAKYIGLFPNVSEDIIKQVGNTALKGAAFNLSAAGTAASEKLVKQCTVLNLNGSELFQKHFSQNINFTY